MAILVIYIQVSKVHVSTKKNWFKISRIIENEKIVEDGKSNVLVVAFLEKTH